MCFYCVGRVMMSSPPLSTLSPCGEGDGAGPSRFPAGASAMRPSAGPGADPHPVPVRGAGGVWHGLFGAEEVHPQRLGS